MSICNMCFMGLPMCWIYKNWSYRQWLQTVWCRHWILVLCKTLEQLLSHQAQLGLILGLRRKALVSAIDHDVGWELFIYTPVIVWMRMIWFFMFDYLVPSWWNCLGRVRREVSKPQTIPIALSLSASFLWTKIRSSHLLLWLPSTIIDSNLAVRRINSFFY